MFTCCFAVWWWQGRPPPPPPPNPSVSILCTIGMLSTYRTEADSGPVTGQTAYLWIVCRDPKMQKAHNTFTSWLKEDKVSMVLHFQWKLVSSALPPALPLLPPTSAGHLCAPHLWNSAAAAHQLNSTSPVLHTIKIVCRALLHPSWYEVQTKARQTNPVPVSWISLRARWLEGLPKALGFRWGQCCFWSNLLSPFLMQQAAENGAQLTSIRLDAGIWGVKQPWQSQNFSDFYSLPSKYFTPGLKGEPHLLWRFGSRCPRASPEIALGESTP